MLFDRFKARYLFKIALVVFLLFLLNWIEPSARSKAASPFQAGGPSIKISDPKVTEGDKGAITARFTLTLTESSKDPISVAFATGNETASSGSDYVAASGNVTFPANSTSQSIDITINGDEIDEPDETFSIKLGKPENATISDGEGICTITDDDATSISISNPSVSEGDSGAVNAVFTVTLSPVNSGPVSVDYRTLDNTADAGKDYTAVSGTLNFAPLSSSQTINVPVLGDNTVEPDETFFVDIKSPNPVTISDGRGTATIRNDDVPLPGVSINNVTVTEGDNGQVKANFTLSLSSSSQEPVSVTYTTEDGTATSLDKDYESDKDIVNFAPGVATQTVSILVNGDNKLEGNETFSVKLSDAKNAEIKGSVGTCTIVNDDEALPTVSVNDITVTEGNSSQVKANFTVSLSAPAKGTVTAEYITEDGTATSLDKDYEADKGIVTFAAGATTQTISILVNGDSKLEESENFVLALSNPSGATIAKGRASCTIANDDQNAPLPSLTVADITVTEGDSGQTKAEFKLTLSASSKETVSIAYSTEDGSATSADKDYEPLEGEVNFAPGAVSMSVTVSVNGDAKFESSETFALTILNAKGADVKDNQAVCTILNDDASLPSLSVNSITVTEGNSGEAKAVFTLTLSESSKQAVSATYLTESDTATDKSDYVGDKNIVSFAPGETSKTVTIAVVGDSVVEPDETFFLVLTDPSNAVIKTDRGTCIIKNDDETVVIPNLSIGDVRIMEGSSQENAKALFTITLSAAAKTPVTADFASADGSANGGSDYTALKGQISFAPGTTTQTVSIEIIGDDVNEADENFSVNLSNANGANVTRAQGICFIINDDEPPSQLPSVSINDVKVEEGDSSASKAVFTLTLSEAVKAPVTVAYATADGTATAGKDYVADKNTVTFEPGVTSRSVSIAVNGDTDLEPDETFTVLLSNSADAKIANGKGTAFIINDDGGGLSSFSINDAKVLEGNSGTTEIVFTVSLSGPTKQTVTVAYATSDGTATTGSDYEAQRGTLTFSPGESKQTLSIKCNGDGANESDETFFIVLSGAANATIDRERGTGVIVNDDAAVQPAVIEFGDTHYRADESGMKAVITIVRTGNGAGKVSVSYTTSNGTAMAGADYVTAFGTVVFDDGDMEKSFAIPIIDDNSVERDETVNLTLTNPTGTARLGDIRSASLNITDDDVSADPVLIVEKSIDFGAVDSNQTAARAVSITNAGSGSLNFAFMLASGAGAGFSLSSQPAKLSLGAGESTSFNVEFKPVQSGLSIGTILISSNGGNAVIKLLASSDVTPPNVTLQSPAGGETIMAGSSFAVRFTGSDEQLAGFIVSYSTDGGATFTNEIGRVGPNENSVVWNVPGTLNTNQAVVKVTGRDQSGNTASDLSGAVSIQKPVEQKSNLRIAVMFTPPPEGDMSPPKNVVVTVLDANPSANAGIGGSKTKKSDKSSRKIDPQVDAAPSDPIGFNIYRKERANEGQTPNTEDVVNDPNNLVGSVPADSNTFIDSVTTDKGNNFTYSVTSFFGNGQQSGGSNTASTDLPVIKNARYDKGAIFMDSAGSFIATQGAVLIIDGKESYALAPDSTGSRFTVSKKTLGTPSGLKLKKLIKTGSTVQIVVKNPDGKLSLSVPLTRTN